MRLTVPILLLAIAGIATFFWPGKPLAHGNGDMPKPILLRHAVMASLAGHLAAIKKALGRSDPNAAGRHAEAIYWLARIIPDAFPKGSGPAMGKRRQRN